MMVRYIDTHCHLQFPQYDEDRDALIAQMRAEGIASIVVGVNRETSEAAVQLAEAHEHLFAAVGLHPNYTEEEPFDEAAFAALAAHPKVVAIGECGLDYFRPTALDARTKERQQNVFAAHMALAVASAKPLMIHARPSKGTNDAYDDVLAHLDARASDAPVVRGNMHFFVGDAAHAQAFAAHGFTVSYTAVLTFARDYDDAVRSVELENLLSETDAPYVAPARRRGKRNDPLAVRDVVQALAEIRGEPEEQVRQGVNATAQRQFSLVGLDWA